MIRAFVAAAVIAVGFGIGVAQAQDMASAEIINTTGKVIGIASFEQTPTGVIIYVEVSDLPPGPHAIHLHSVGACTPDFKASHGHINPNMAKHGLRNPEGPDNGDLPNLFAANDGTARAEFFTTRVKVSDRAMLVLVGDDQPALLDEDGSALVIHENPDDHMTQPIGGAGGRIACGVIER